MKYWKTISLALLGVAVSFAVVAGDADARGRGGQGMGLRDGSCVYGTGAQQPMSGQAMARQKGYGRGACLAAGTGNPACPRLQAGTGPRSGFNRQ